MNAAAVFASAGMDYEASHFGICVSDLERSMRFYCEGLGFTKIATYECGDEFEASLEVSGPIGLTAQFIQREAWSSSSLYNQIPAVTGSPSQHRNQLGLTHLSFVVDDVELRLRDWPDTADASCLLPE